MRRVLYILLLLVISLYSVAGTSNDKGNKKDSQDRTGVSFKISDIVFKITSDSTCELTKCRMSGRIELPDSITYEDKNYALTAIGPMAFSDYEKVSENDMEVPKTISSTFSATNVVLPQTVEKIGYGAFFRCYSIESLEIKGGIDEIEYATFFECKNLKEIINGVSATKSKENIQYTPKSNTPISPKKVYGHAFEKCEMLQDIDFTSLEYIGENAFSDCKSLKGSVAIRHSVKHLGSNAFSGCRAISEASIMANISEVPDGVFCGCTSLCKVSISDAISTIGNSAFSGCCELTNIKLPSSTKKIGNYAFENCKKIETINIPTSTKTIGDGAFFDCSNLIVRVHHSVKSIGSGAFFNCKGRQIF